MEIATEWVEIFVQFPVVVGGAHAQMRRAIQIISQAHRYRRHPLAATRSLDDHFVHVRAHGCCPDRSQNGAAQDTSTKSPVNRQQSVSSEPQARATIPSTLIASRLSLT